MARGALILFAGFLVFIFLSFPADAKLYQWTDENGQVHSTDDIENIPKQYRTPTQIKILRSIASPKETPFTGSSKGGKGGEGTDEASVNVEDFGTSSTPQITYIKDNATSTRLRGHVRGYGVLVVEGRTTIGGDFRFKGLVIHKKSDTSHYISFEDRPWVYGGVLFGSTDGNVTFRVEDFSRLFYSSEALAIVDSNWGSLLPRPARIYAWVDK